MKNLKQEICSLPKTHANSKLYCNSLEYSNISKLMHCTFFINKLKINQMESLCKQLNKL